LECIFLSFDSDQGSDSVMSILGMIDVLSLEHGGVFDIGCLVNASGEEPRTGLVGDLAVGLSKHILTLHAWDITPVSCERLRGDGAYLEFACARLIAEGYCPRRYGLGCGLCNLASNF
jgi:hypothetical protein